MLKQLFYGLNKVFSFTWLSNKQAIALFEEVLECKYMFRIGFMVGLLYYLF